MSKPVITIEIPGKVEGQYLVLMEGEDLNELIEVADVLLWSKGELTPLENYAKRVRTAGDSTVENNLENLPQVKRKTLDDLLGTPRTRKPQATKAKRATTGRTKGKK